ncbi:MAG TPA: hypothetical protein VGL35_13410 [Rhizomicrobium sp.]|jgi:hypothetical protein
MRAIRNAIIAGAAAVLLCGAFSFAAAMGRKAHFITIRFPGGAVEQIRYTGDLPPEVVVAPDNAAFGPDWPLAFFDPAPFPTIDRISAEMDRQMAETIRSANALAAQSISNPQGLTEIGSGKLPAGSESYSFVSTGGGNVFCARSVEITSRADGQKPRVVSRTYGNCGNSGASVGSGARSGPSSADRPDSARVIDYAAPSSGGLLREASAAE